MYDITIFTYIYIYYILYQHREVGAYVVFLDDTI